MQSPVLAILWESWRLTRVEAAWKLVVGFVGGLAVLALCATFAPADDAKAYEDMMDGGAAAAMILLVLPHVVSWLSLARLNGGRPGFPLYLHYIRPVRTAVIVWLPMAYLTALSSAVYLVSALLLRVTSGYAFPLLPVAAWIAALTLIGLAATWSTRNKTIQAGLTTNAFVMAFYLAMERLTAVEIPDTFDWPPRLWPTLFDFPLTDYAWIGLIGLASFGVTVAGVTRQRRGDGWAEVPSAQRDGFWDRLVNVFQLPCPTSSATRAQVWFDLKSSGLPLLTIGVALAIVILPLGVVSRSIDTAIAADASCSARGCFYTRPLVVLFSMFSPLIVLFLGGNAFGIRRRQGRTYLSAFDATQACGTAQLTALKLLVKSACLLAALIAVGVSAWTSLSTVGDEVFLQMWSVPLSSQLRAITGAMAALTGYEQLALVVVPAVGILVWVAAFAACEALWARYPRRLTIAGSLLLLYFVVLFLVTLVGQREFGRETLGDALFGTTSWLAVAALVLITVYLLWRVLDEQLLTLRQTGGALLVSAAFAAAWMTLLRAAGVEFAGMPTAETVWILSPMLLTLMASVLAPWSLSRIRHT